MASDMARRWSEIEESIRLACDRVGRMPGDVRVVAVSKGHGPERVTEAAELGLRVFGESRIQEAHLKRGCCSGSLEWHFIGHLQTNKAREAVRGFELIHSMDRWPLAQELEKWAARAARTQPVLVQVNVAGEASKYGVAPGEAVAIVRRLGTLPHLEVQGLMTLAPWSEDPERVRPVFRRLAELRRACEDDLGVPLPHLSMGMSGDFVVAVEEGATLVRIGTALFGSRTGR